MRRAVVALGLVAFIAAALPLLQRWGPTHGATTESRASAESAYANLPLSFEPNVGQSDPSVRFVARRGGASMFFTPSEVVLSLTQAKPSASSEGQSPDPNVAPPASTVRVRFEGANSAAAIDHGESLPGRVNYIQGGDPARWFTDLPTYRGIVYSGLYPGIDLHYEGGRGGLKGTYTVAAGADPAQIRWRYQGADDVRVDPTGDLQVRLAPPPASAGIPGKADSITEEAPVAWQEVGGRRRAVAARYHMAADGNLRFALGSYDRAQPLTIDPTLAYSTYLGGSDVDEADGIAVDSAGSAYVTGLTRSTNFPAQGGYQGANVGGADAFIAKLSPSGTALSYATYLGGADGDTASGIAVDGSGSAYITGNTASNNFPTTEGAYRREVPPRPGGCLGPNGVPTECISSSHSIYVAKLNPTGSLAYSTFVGPSVVLTESRADLDRVAQALLEQESLSAAELALLVSDPKAASGVVAPDR